MKTYYCYLNKGSPVLTETKPEGFDELACNDTIMAPNLEIAGRIYDADLTIMRWRDNNEKQYKSECGQDNQSRKL